MKPSIFVTGAAGYLGSRLVGSEGLEQLGRLVCLRRTGYAHPGSAVEWVQGDLLEPESYRPALAGCDIVLHMAAATGRQDVATFVRDNITATFQLIQACVSAGVSRFLYVSSMAAKMTDTADSVYADTKKHAEQLVTGSDLQFTIIRPAIVLGRDAPVFRRFVRVAMAPVVPVFGGGKGRLQPIWVDDLLDVIRCVLAESWFEGQVVDAGGPETITMATFLKKIRRVCGRHPAPMIHIPWGIVMPIFRPIERRAPRALPVSLGELKAFTIDGTAEPHPYMARWKGRMKGIDDMLMLALPQ